MEILFIGINRIEMQAVAEIKKLNSQMDMNPELPADRQPPSEANPSKADKTVIDDPYAYYRMLVELSPMGILILDHRRRILLVNQAAALLLGEKSADLIGKDILSFLHPDSWEAGSELLRVKTPAHREAAPRELALLQRDGSSLWVDVFTAGIPWAGHSAVYVTMHEVTKRKQLVRDSESLLRSIIDSIPLPVYIKDDDGRYLFVNEAAARSGRTTSDAVVGKRDSDFLPNIKDIEQLRQADREVLATGKPQFWIENTVSDFEGKPRVIQISKVPFTLPGESRTVILGVSRDVTEQKKVEAELQASESRYRELIENLNEVVYTASETGVFTFIGPSVKTLFGISPEVMIGKTMWEFFPPEDRPNAKQRFESVIAGEKKSSVYRIAREDGSFQWLRTSSHPLVRDGRIVGAWGLFADITDLKRTEETLREQEEHFRQIAENAGEGILIVDANRRVLYANPQAETLLGIPAGELLGMDAVRFLIPEERDDAAQRARDRFADFRQPERAFQRVVHSEGRIFPVEIISARTKWSNQEALLLMFHDVTERLAMEEMQRRHEEELEKKLIERTEHVHRIEQRQAEFEKLAAVSGLAARIAHEINNPLAGVKNACRIVKERTDPDAPHAKYIQLVEKEVDRMTRIVQELYDLCRPGPKPTGDFRVAEVVGEIVSLLEAISSGCNVRIETSVRPSDGVYFGNEDAVRQILFNLVKNGIEASAAGGTVVVGAEVEPMGLRISVSDQGTGIGEEERLHMFEPFFSTKRTRDAMGLGLGLSVSKSLIDALNGTIECDTAPGTGSTFRVWLPSCRL